MTWDDLGSKFTERLLSLREELLCNIAHELSKSITALCVMSVIQFDRLDFVEDETCLVEVI
jgi:hypothetical protein